MKSLLKLLYLSIFMLSLSCKADTAAEPKEEQKTSGVKSELRESKEGTTLSNKVIYVTLSTGFYTISVVQGGQIVGQQIVQTGGWTQMWQSLTTVRNQNPGVKLFAEINTSWSGIFGGPIGYFNIQYNNINNLDQGCKLLRQISPGNSQYVEIQEGFDSDDCTNAFEWLNVVNQNGTQEHKNFLSQLSVKVWFN